jgi:hypothetical protein
VNKGKHVQLQAQTSFLLPSLLFSATSNLLSTCLSDRNEPVSFLLSSNKKKFPSHFSNSPTRINFFVCSAVSEVVGGRLAQGANSSQQLIFPTLPLCPEPNKQGSLLIQINYTKTMS